MDQWTDSDIRQRLAMGRLIAAAGYQATYKQRRQQMQLNELRQHLQLNELRQHRAKLNAELQAVENEINRYGADDCAKSAGYPEPQFNRGMAAGEIGSAADRIGPTNEDIVRHHAPDGRQIDRITSIRLATRNLMDVIDANSPRCADQSAAKRAAREAMMWANSAIVLDGAV